MYERRAPWRVVWMDVAAAVAPRSSCLRSKVGSVVVYDNLHVFVGYNGPAPGKTNCDQGGCPRGQKSFRDLPSASVFSTPQGYCTAVHAEINARDKFLASGRTVDAKTVLYTTREPCEGCWSALFRTGFTPPQVIWSR